jgi:hypothetical protein
MSLYGREREEEDNTAKTRFLKHHQGSTERFFATFHEGVIEEKGARILCIESHHDRRQGSSFP